MSSQYLISEQALEGKKHIQPYLERGEGQHVEYKQRLNLPDKIAKTICALANTSGGTLLVGIKDDRSIFGVDPDQEKYILNEAVSFYIEPALPIQVTEVFVTDDEFPHDEKSVLLVKIPESKEKPHRAKNKQNEWQVYLRHRDQTLMAGAKGEKQLASEPVETTTPLDKNQKKLLSYLKKKPKITLKEYASLVNISERRARRELMQNLDLGLVRILEHEKDDYYVL
ncbi:ATP-binding protein [Fulvivirga sp. RKSG066]|uniref:AlbA family DNA-binding domain-containing protein n=1 Tax=Fulvivirga aurantia TaxID=2529383 RepID=UPI0012BCB44A|nr:ATP-binding protein [Fulvivirga aurantia]MTI22913.1 ATP-binding protein [Fulvivirga aurantia]